MDKNTLSNYGWIVIAVLVLSVMIALATPFGSYIEQGVRSTTEGLFNTSQNAMNTAFGDLGVEVKDQTFEEGYTAPSNNKEYDHNAPDLHPNGVIPEGGTYIEASGNMLLSGDAFPLLSEGDMYIYNDYIYIAGTNEWGVMLFTDNLATNFNSAFGINLQSTDNLQTSYDPILESINHNPIVSIDNLFDGCTELVTAPEIPTGVKTLNSTFAFCNKLTTAPDINHCTDLKEMNHTFHGCTSLINGPQIPNTVDSMYGTFNNCTSLVVEPKIPSSVTTEKQYLFNGCTQFGY